ncbi:ATP-binding cassette domain-containing protein [soil metagenome]
MSLPAEEVVRIEHLSYAYGERTAIDDLSLSVNTGEIFGFLGPNGSGKSTLFRILSTLIEAPAVRVTMFGLDLRAGRDAIRSKIGVVFQSPSLDKQLTARENLKHQGHLYGLAGAELRSRIDDSLARVRLTDRQHERVGTFSGGMRRRVELAKGLLHRPSLLLLDEPSTGLDPGARIDLWQTLQDVRRTDGVTVMLTTHLMEEADQCDRLAVLDRGKLLACDSPSALKSTIGGDVITLVTRDPAEAAIVIRETLGLTSKVMDGVLRIEAAEAHLLIPRLIESLPGKVDSISMGRPTLQDVFVRLTGHGLDSGADLPA